MRFLIYKKEKSSDETHSAYIASDINDGLGYIAYQLNMVCELEYTDAMDETRKKKRRDAIKHGIYKCLEGKRKSYLGFRFRKITFAQKKEGKTYENY